MNIFKLKAVDRPFFSVWDISQVLDISIESARNAACRYVKSGLLIRAARDIYILKDRFVGLDLDEKLKLANLIQPSSYISFMSALSYMEISTQIQQDYFESCALIRSKDKDVANLKYKYFRMRKELYFGFEKINGIFIAGPEKALLDSLYLMSMKRYAMDISSLSNRGLDKKKLAEFLKRYPKRTRLLWEKIRERID